VPSGSNGGNSQFCFLQETRPHPPPEKIAKEPRRRILELKERGFIQPKESEERHDQLKKKIKKKGEKKKVITEKRIAERPTLERGNNKKKKKAVGVGRDVPQDDQGEWKFLQTARETARGRKKKEGGACGAGGGRGKKPSTINTKIYNPQ